MAGWMRTTSSCSSRVGTSDVNNADVRNEEKPLKQQCVRVARTVGLMFLTPVSAKLDDFKACTTVCFERVHEARYRSPCDMQGGFC